jgi:hypothetical protein
MSTRQPEILRRRLRLILLAALPVKRNEFPHFRVSLVLTMESISPSAFMEARVQ